MINKKENTDSLPLLHQYKQGITTLLLMIECVAIAAIGLGIHFKIPMAYYCAAPVAGLNALLIIALCKTRPQSAQLRTDDSKEEEEILIHGEMEREYIGDIRIKEQLKTLNLEQVLKGAYCYLSYVTLHLPKKIELYFVVLAGGKWEKFTTLDAARNFVEHNKYIEIETIETKDKDTIFITYDVWNAFFQFRQNYYFQPSPEMQVLEKTDIHGNPVYCVIETGSQYFSSKI